MSRQASFRRLNHADHDLREISDEELTVEIDRGCSLKPCAADFHSWHSEIAASADNFRADQDQSQPHSSAFGFGVLNVSVLVAMRRVN